MSETVTVDLADLETLVFTTGAIQQVEAALLIRKNDPFVKQHLPGTEAHNRLAAAVRSAHRSKAETKIKWDAELTDEEVGYVRRKQKEKGAIPEWPVQVVGLSQDWGDGGYKPAGEWDIVQSLMAKGVLVRGQLIKGIKWDDETQPILKLVPDTIMVRLTARGKAKLAA